MSKKYDQNILIGCQIGRGFMSKFMRIFQISCLKPAVAISISKLYILFGKKSAHLILTIVYINIRRMCVHNENQYYQKWRKWCSVKLCFLPSCCPFHVSPSFNLKFNFIAFSLCSLFFYKITDVQMQVLTVFFL